MKQLFDYLKNKMMKRRAEENSSAEAAPETPPEPKRPATAKPEIDERIYRVKDSYGFGPDMKPSKDNLPKNAAELFADIEKVIRKGREVLTASGTLPPETIGVFRNVIVANRGFMVRAEFHFKDNPDGTSEARLCSKFAEYHKNLDKLMKAFLN